MSRISREIEFGKRIRLNAEDVWGWNSIAGKLRATRRANYLVDSGEFTSGDKLLEIGCVTGVFTEKVYNKTKASITAIDISIELLDQAQLKLPSVEFKVADAMGTDMPAESFDGIYGSSVLHHLDVDSAIAEIYRLLKPGGRMVFAEPNIFNPQIFIERNVGWVKKWLGVTRDETAINRWKMRKRLKNNGFVNSMVFPYDFLHPYTPEWMIGFVRRIGSVIEKIPVLKEIAGSVIIYAKKPEPL